MAEHLSRPEQQLLTLLPDVTGLPATVDRTHSKDPGRGEPDLIIRLGQTRLVVEMKSSGEASQVATAIRQLKEYVRPKDRNLLPVVVVPYMGEVGQNLCREAGIAWIDLSGNARIVAPGLRVIVEGRPNRFKKVGRPKSVFAPKSSRVVRALLLEPRVPMSQRELAARVELDEGYVSRIVRGLEQDGFLTRDSDGKVTANDPGLLLKAWHEQYDFSKHTTIMGHIPARSGEGLLFALGRDLREKSVEYAATGLGAAWLFAPFADFRLVTLFLKNVPTDDLLNGLSFRQDSRGANVWLVLPNDSGVFLGSQDRQGTRCVSSIQVYLDLKAQPERSREASEELLKRALPWSESD